MPGPAEIEMYKSYVVRKNWLADSLLFSIVTLFTSFMFCGFFIEKKRPKRKKERAVMVSLDGIVRPILLGVSLNYMQTTKILL